MISKVLSPSSLCAVVDSPGQGRIESTIRFVKQNLWLGIKFDSLTDLNQQARSWMEKVNRQMHSTTREVPYDRLAKERLLLIHADSERWRSAFRGDVDQRSELMSITIPK